MTRVLFVDDEPNVLSGIRRMLRAARVGWDTEFVDNGVEALELLRSRPVEVVVSDMRMPLMDGATLLREVKKQHPDTIRIVLSGQSSPKDVLKVVTPAHRFLAKPCDADELIGAVRRSIELRKGLNEPLVTALVSDVGALPVLPELLTQLSEELNAPQPRLEVVADVMAQDPSMCATVLKLVNSAFFGLRREVSEVRGALAFLGTDTIASLVLAEGVFRQFDPEASGGFSLAGAWSHSSRTARLAQQLAKDDHVDAAIPQLVFTAGMLHNLGRVMLATSPHTRTPEADLLDPTTHAAVCAYLLGLWGLPDAIVEAVRYHEHPSRVTSPIGAEVTAYLHVASALSEPHPDGGGAEDVEERLDRPYLDTRFGVDRVDVWSSKARALLED